MKKVLVVIVVLIATVSMSKAQVFIGGGVGFDYNGGTFKFGGNSLDKPSETAFIFFPKAGFYLNNNFAIGLEVDIISLSRKTPKEFRYGDYGYGYYGYFEDLKENLFAWGISAFARYDLVEVGKFSLLLECPFGIVKSKTKETQGSITRDVNPTLAFGIAVLPVLSYDLTDKFSIEASCDFIRLGFTSTIVDNKDITNNFGFGINSSSLNNSIPMTISCIFKF